MSPKAALLRLLLQHRITVDPLMGPDLLAGVAWFASRRRPAVSIFPLHLAAGAVGAKLAAVAVMLRMSGATSSWWASESRLWASLALWCFRLGTSAVR
jgi:hypothetical protein